MRAVVLLNLGLLALGAWACKVEIDESKQNINWWKTSVVYQIYPRSFKDSNGDGVGDLNGITEKLEHIKDTGADAFWLSPIYPSPQADFGYDISNFIDIDPIFGTLDDFKKLVKKAKELNLKVLLDFVPNHSSDKHEWFQKSIERVKPYDEYYIWKDAKTVNEQRAPPNNWLSAFGGSAWEWNEERKQYYYHAFAAQQPDLNYHNPQLAQEMKNVLAFWMKLGVDGFRVDAVNHMFEDTQLRDDTRSGKDVPSDDYDYLNHLYTRDLPETYEVVRSWQDLLDYYVRNYRTDGKFMILEAYTTIANSMKFYEVGANPFNFMFISELNENSKAVDFKRTIDKWINAVPKNKVINWVVGNHDNHRVASRYGENRADQISMLASVLPGITVVYNGDEIGMIDREFAFEETVDPAGINAGPDRYKLKSRDPERTPFQWDDTTNAGFSTSTKTWLPVHSNYRTLNLVAQKAAAVSHYKVFQALTALKKTQILQKGETEVLLATDKVLAVIRRLTGERPNVLLMNFDNSEVEIDGNSWLNIPEELKVYTASVGSNLASGTVIDTTKLKIPAAASVILN